MTCGDVCGLRVEQLLLSTTGSSHSCGRSQCHNDVWALVTASCGYYILHWSLYYKRLAARKGGATLDAPSTTHAVRVFPKRCLGNRICSLYALLSTFSFHASHAILHALVDTKRAFVATPTHLFDCLRSKQRARY